MSDTPQGPGWWKASDDKWYPPESHPEYQAPAGESAAPEPAPTPPGEGPTAPVPEASPAAVDEAPAAQPVPPTADAGDPTAPQPVPPGPPPPGGDELTAPQPLPPVPPAAGAPEPTAEATSGDGGGGRNKILYAVLAVVLLAAAAFVAISVLGDDEASASVDLESVGDAGQDPFFSPIAPPPTATLSAFVADGPAVVGGSADPEGEGGDDPDGETDTDDAESDDDAAGSDDGYRTLDGSVPGLYGGTLNEAACDVDQLAGLLAEEEAKARAWADALEIDPADVATYIGDLTSVHLASDARVTTHGFRDGEATPREAIIQRGSAVLVDLHGVPRVNCYSGAPLSNPQNLADGESYTGDRWTAFDPAEVTVIEGSATELGGFDLIDIATGELFNRPAGSSGDADGAPVNRPATTDRLIDGPIDLNREYQDELEGDRTTARYTFEVPDGAVLVLRGSNDRESVQRIRVRASAGGSSYANFYLSPGESDEVVIGVDHEGGTQFELEISGGPARYSFEVESEVQDDAGQGGDAGGDFGTAFEVESGDAVAGVLVGDDDHDHYLLELPEGGHELAVRIENDRGSTQRVRARVMLEGETLLNVYVSPGSNEDWAFLFGHERSGTLEVEVSGGPADYRFTAALTAQNDAGDAGDAGDTLENPRQITVGQEVAGQVGLQDPADFYTFEHPGADLVVTVTNPAGSQARIQVRVQDPSGSSVASEYVAAGSTGTLTVGATEAGSVHRVIVDGGRADYTFTITTGGPADGG